jgi:hypothetical protein
MATKTATKKAAPKTKRATKVAVERPVLVMTGLRGVFFGYATDVDGETVRITRARNVFQWSTPPAAEKGILGLASVGPMPGSKIGARAPALTLRNITGVAECSPEAVTRFEAATWG